MTKRATRRRALDRDTRNAIERATQRARKILEDDFAAQLEGDFDVHRNGTVAPKAGAHLSAREIFQREKIIAVIEHKRSAGMDSPQAVADYIRNAAFTTLNRFVALKMLEARELLQECITKGEQSSGYREFCGLAPGLLLLPDSGGQAFTSPAPCMLRYSLVAVCDRFRAGFKRRRGRVVSRGSRRARRG